MLDALSTVRPMGPVIQGCPISPPLHSIAEKSRVGPSFPTAPDAGSNSSRGAPHFNIHRRVDASLSRQRAQAQSLKAKREQSPAYTDTLH